MVVHRVVSAVVFRVAFGVAYTVVPRVAVVYRGSYRVVCVVVS